MLSSSMFLGWVFSAEPDRAHLFIITLPGRQRKNLGLEGPRCRPVGSGFSYARMLAEQILDPHRWNGDGRFPDWRHVWCDALAEPMGADAWTGFWQSLQKIVFASRSLQTIGGLSLAKCMNPTPTEGRTSRGFRPGLRSSLVLSVSQLFSIGSAPVLTV